MDPAGTQVVNGRNRTIAYNGMMQKSVIDTEENANGQDQSIIVKQTYSCISNAWQLMYYAENVTTRTTDNNQVAGLNEVETKSSSRALMQTYGMQFDDPSKYDGTPKSTVQANWSTRQIVSTNPATNKQVEVFRQTSCDGNSTSRYQVNNQVKTGTANWSKTVGLDAEDSNGVNANNLDLKSIDTSYQDNYPDGLGGSDTNFHFSFNRNVHDHTDFTANGNLLQSQSGVNWDYRALANVSDMPAANGRWLVTMTNNEGPNQVDTVVDDQNFWSVIGRFQQWPGWRMEILSVSPTPFMPDMVGPGCMEDMGYRLDPTFGMPPLV
jgi:hypothetical protein